jgi:hypothetical protein
MVRATDKFSKSRLSTVNVSSRRRSKEVQFEKKFSSSEDFYGEDEWCMKSRSQEQQQNHTYLLVRQWATSEERKQVSATVTDQHKDQERGGPGRPWACGPARLRAQQAYCRI